MGYNLGCNFGDLDEYCIKSGICGTPAHHQQLSRIAISLRETYQRLISPADAIIYPLDLMDVRLCYRSRFGGFYSCGMEMI